MFILLLSVTNKVFSLLIFWVYKSYILVLFAFLPSFENCSFFSTQEFFPQNSFRFDNSKSVSNFPPTPSFPSPPPVVSLSPQLSHHLSLFPCLYTFGVSLFILPLSPSLLLCLSLQTKPLRSNYDSVLHIPLTNFFFLLLFKAIVSQLVKF